MADLYQPQHARGQHVLQKPNRRRARRFQYLSGGKPPLWGRLNSYMQATVAAPAGIRHGHTAAGPLVPLSLPRHAHTWRRREAFTGAARWGASRRLSAPTLVVEAITCVISKWLPRRPPQRPLVLHAGPPRLAVSSPPPSPSPHRRLFAGGGRAGRQHGILNVRAAALCEGSALFVAVSGGGRAVAAAEEERCAHPHGRRRRRHCPPHRPQVLQVACKHGLGETTWPSPQRTTDPCGEWLAKRSCSHGVGRAKVPSCACPRLRTSTSTPSARGACPHCALPSVLPR